MNSAKTIPVDFIKPIAPLAITEAEAIELLSLNKSTRNARAAKDAFKRFRDQHKIRPLPGFVFALKQLERACGV